MRRALVLSVAFAAVAACTFTRDLDYLSESRPFVASGSVPPVAGAVPEGETPQAATCNPENVLVADGKTTNLDRTMNGSAGRATLGGQCR